MRQALYRKYRSRSFKDVVGQEHVTKTLRSAIGSGRISHAYLFTGPRGVGKTSVARILAHEVNNLAYDDESVHLDIIEIDAASNRRIDEVRDLREKVRIAPASAKFKVYIIDEVHMLTREAFNALLKTLEEPPAHCIFILATTEAHKLPETIISRTQRFEFKPIGQAEAADHLGAIAKREKIDIDKDALQILADFGRGSFRDSISYLDQLSVLPGKISADDVRQALGLPSKAEISSMAQNLRAGNLKGTMENLQSIKDQGVDAAAAAAALAAVLRDLVSSDGADRALIGLLRQLIEVPASSQPYDYLEIALLEACQAEADQNPTKAEKADSSLSGKTGGSGPVAKETKPAGSQDNRKGDFQLKDWEEVVRRAKDQAASIYTALRLAEPELDEDGLVLKFRFPLHQKKIEQSKNKQLVSSIIEELTKKNVTIRCVVDKTAFSDQPEAKPAPPVMETPSLKSISNIFGGAEVLES